MNDKQRKVLIVVACVVVAMLLYAPFAYRYPNGAVASAGYALIFSPPRSATVDISTLLVEWLGAAIAGGIAFVLARG